MVQHVTWSIQRHPVVGRLAIAVLEDSVIASAILDGGDALPTATWQRLGWRIDQRDHPLARAAAAGHAVAVAHPQATDFERTVLASVAAIPTGSTSTYGRIAAAIGRPGAARAVAGAIGRNRIPVIVPCHRVLAAHGLGGYTCGGRQAVAIKRQLLAAEGIAV